jgi:hypothetical protein
MAYSQNLANSAKRHLRAANELYNTASSGAHPQCKAVAGYLYGLAGELALKEIMRASGLRPLELSERRNDPFYAHFPDLKTMLQDMAQGRRAAELRKISSDSKLFQNWNTNMRYARQMI